MDSTGGALLVGMDSTGEESSMRKQAEEEAAAKRSETARMSSEMQRHAQEPTGALLSVRKHDRRMETREEEERGMRKVSENHVENSTGIHTVCQDKSARSEMLQETKMDGRSGKFVVTGQQSSKLLPHGRKNPMTLLLKDMSNKFAILDHNGDDESDEMDRGKSDVEACLNTIRGMVDSNTTMVESGKFLLQPADPSSATDSMTRSGQYSVQDDLETGKSATTPLANKADDEMADEAESFASYRRAWECSWSQKCGFFEDITVLSSMLFTHYTPGLVPLGSAGGIPKTLQILSLKLTKNDGGLEFPLSVYGVVAARDMVDRNRNVLFYCNSRHAQELKENDTFLRLTGPSRAIVLKEEVDFEIELEVKGAPLIRCARRYKRGYRSGVSSIICFENSFCALELSLQPVGETVQATILDVKVAKGNGSWPLKYGGLVACYPLSGEIVFADGRFSRNTNPSSSKIVLLDSKYGAMQVGFGGRIHLSRQVVSVEFGGGLDVVVQAYSESGGGIAAESRVHFKPQKSNISQQECLLGGAQVVITVAWSLVPTDKMDIQLGEGGMRVA